MQFTSGYYAFITNLDVPLPDANDRAQAENARTTYMNAVDELNQATMNLGDHWKTLTTARARCRGIRVGRTRRAIGGQNDLAAEAVNRRKAKQLNNLFGWVAAIYIGHDVLDRHAIKPAMPITCIVAVPGPVQAKKTS